MQLAKFLSNGNLKIEKELVYTNIVVRVLPLYGSLMRFRFVRKSDPNELLFELSEHEMKDLAREITKLSKLSDADITV